MMKTDFAGKRVTILGLSDSGLAAAKLLKGLNAKVKVSELRKDDSVITKLAECGWPDYEIGCHTRPFIIDSDAIVLSPGIPLSADPVRWAAEAGISVMAELELGYIMCMAPIIAVTGSNGKSTTVSLAHHLLSRNGVSSYLRGNIGTPLCHDAVKMPPDSVVALEVSSFQLETIKTFRPKVSVFLNLSANHLDRYNNMDEYRRAKARIFENQDRSDYAVVNYDDAESVKLAKSIKADIYYFSLRQKVRGSYVFGERLVINTGGGKEELCRISDIPLYGLHNIANVLAAGLAVRLIKPGIDVAGAVKSFSGLKYRFELVAEIEGVKFIDDSKSTTVDSTIMALQSFDNGRVVLIAGGKDKGCDYSQLKRMSDRLKHMILIGEASGLIRKALAGCHIAMTDAATMPEAVRQAAALAKAQDAVLLSPMCSSFDMFRDYKERGDKFREAVNERLFTDIKK